MTPIATWSRGLVRGSALSLFNSAGEMTEAERRALLDEFTRLGFRAAPPAGHEDDWIRIDPNHPGAAHLRKLLACAYELERIGAVRSANSTGRWLRKLVRKITGVEALQWLDAKDCNKVIEALKGWRKKFLAKHPSAGETSRTPPPRSRRARS